MKNLEKFDLNEKTETTASDSTEYPTFRPIATEDVPPLPEKDAEDILDKNLQESFSDDDKFTHENIPKLKITILKAMHEYSHLQNKQLTEKNRELEEYKRLNTISLSGYTPEELHDKISTLQDRVRELEDILNGSISME